MGGMRRVSANINNNIYLSMHNIQQPYIYTYNNSRYRRKGCCVALFNLSPTRPLALRGYMKKGIILNEYIYETTTPKVAYQPPKFSGGYGSECRGRSSLTTPNCCRCVCVCVWCCALPTTEDEHKTRPGININNFAPKFKNIFAQFFFRFYL